MSSHVTTMHAHSPGSYSLSLMLHGALIAAIVISAYVVNDAQKNKSSDVMEVVAGPGDNYMATHAPAIGTPDSINFTAPPNSAPAPVPVQAQPVEPPPASTPKTQPQAPVTPVAHDALVIPPTTKKTPSKTTVQPSSSQMTWEEFQKKNAGKNKNQPSSKTPATAPSSVRPGKAVVAPTISSPGKGLAGGVLGGSGAEMGAQGTALTAAQHDQMDAYFGLLAERIKAAFEKPDGVSSELSARVEYQVHADGTIGAVKIIRSSGNRTFDNSVLKAFRTARGIGPRPDGRDSSITTNFRLQEES